jgi:perosamine synthetase
MDEIVTRKRAIAAAYIDFLQDVPGIQLPAEEPWAKNVYWAYGIMIDEKIRLSAAKLADRLRERSIETRPFFLGMHEQPVFQNNGLFHGEHYPVAEQLARQGLYIPRGLTISDLKISEVANAVKECLK